MNQGLYPVLFKHIVVAVAAAATITFTDGTTTGGGGGTTQTATLNGGVRTGKWVVCVGSDATSGQVDPTSCSFAGTALTKAIGLSNTRSHSSIWYSTTDITTDGTDDVSAVWASVSQNSGSMIVSLYAVANVLSMTPTATTSSSATPSDLSINVSANGIVAGITLNRNSTTAVWTGFSASNGDVEKTSGTMRDSTQHNSFSTAQTPAALSVTTGGTSSTASVSASWR